MVEYPLPHIHTSSRHLTRISRIVEMATDDVVEEIGLSCRGGEKLKQGLSTPKSGYEPIHDFCELGITTLTSQPTRGHTSDWIFDLIRRDMDV